MTEKMREMEKQMEEMKKENTDLRLLLATLTTQIKELQTKNEKEKEKEAPTPSAEANGKSKVSEEEEGMDEEERELWEHVKDTSSEEEGGEEDSVKESKKVSRKSRKSRRSQGRSRERKRESDANSPATQTQSQSPRDRELPPLPSPSPPKSSFLPPPEPNPAPTPAPTPTPTLPPPSSLANPDIQKALADLDVFFSFPPSSTQTENPSPSPVPASASPADHVVDEIEVDGEEKEEEERGKEPQKEEKSAKKSGKGRKKRELVTIKKTWTGRGGMAAAMQKYEEEMRKEEEKEKERGKGKEKDREEREKDKRKAGAVAPVLSRYQTDTILGQYDFPSYIRQIVLIQRFFRRVLREKRTRQERLSVKIIDELIETEEVYVRSLQTLIDTFHSPLLALSKQKYPLASPEEVKQIFSEIVVIQLYNQNFLADLCQRKAVQEGTPWMKRKYGDIIDNITQFLRSYTAYYNNYHAALTTLAKCTERPKFKEWLEKKEQEAGEGLTSLLIRPIQRVPKYVLLLRDLLKNTPSSHPDLPALRDAERNMGVIARDLNERMKDAEVFMEVLRINGQLNPPYKELIQPHRRFVREGPILYRTSERSKPKPMWIILFNDVLLVTQPPTNSIFNRTDRNYKLDVVLLLERATAVVPLADR